MGYELESPPRRAGASTLPEAEWAALECRWSEEQQRFARALAEAAALRRELPANHPLLIGAQLELAEARRRCWQLASAVGDADDL